MIFRPRTTYLYLFYDGVSTETAVPPTPDEILDADTPDMLEIVKHVRRFLRPSEFYRWVRGDWEKIDRQHVGLSLWDRLIIRWQP